MKKAILIFGVLLGILSLSAQAPDLNLMRQNMVTPQLLEFVATGNAANRLFSFNFSTSPYDLPDATDIADPLTGLFYEDQIWVKDFTRHINNPDDVALALSFHTAPTHFTVSQPDPENPLKLAFQPLPENWHGSEMLILVASDNRSGADRAISMAIIILNVTPVPDPPLWIGLPVGNVFTTDEETPLLIDFRDYVNCVDSADPDNFDLFITPAEDPILITQEPTAAGYLATFLPLEDYNGTASYTVTAVDRLSGALSPQELHIQVLGVNDPPEITAYLPIDLTLHLEQGDNQVFSVSVTDAEADPLEHSWIHSGVNNGVPFSNVVSTTAELQITFNLAGTQTIEYTVSDGLATDTVTWTIIVRPLGPQFSPVGGTFTEQIEVALTVPDGFTGAQIHYTTDGSEPTALSPLYVEPVVIPALPDMENNVTIKAFFIHADYPDSRIESQSYTITGTVSQPVFAPTPGLYYAPIEVQLNSSNPGADIYFTTDLSQPVPGNPGTFLYFAPIPISALQTVTVKALATRAGWLDSQTVSATYQVTGTVVIQAQTLTPPPLPDGEFYLVEPGEAITVTIDGLVLEPAEATLYYTLDNSLPGPGNPASSIYTSGMQINLSNPTWLNLKAYLADWQPSATFSYYYDIRTRTRLNAFPNGTVFDPAPGYSTVPVTVSLSTSTAPAGAAIYFTLDGTDPTPETGQLYTQPIPVTATTLIKVMALYPGLYPSLIQGGLFQITGTVDQPQFDPLPGSYDAPLNLSISTILDGTDIYYTLDDSEPSQESASSTLYLGPIPLGLGHHVVKAKAYKEFWDASPVSAGDYNIGILPSPEYDLAGGLYFDPIVVHLSLPTVPDASIYYTLDGSEPTTASLLYNAGTGIPIGLETSFMISAIAARTGWLNSPVSQRSYQVTGTVATPVFEPGGGVYPIAPNVTITTTTPGATIRYTLDGTDPTPGTGMPYTEPLLISSSATLKAQAYKTDWRSSGVQGDVYTIIGTIGDPVFTPGAGTYTAPVDVYISVNPPDATVYYTTDGSTPSLGNGTVYQTGSPINIQTSTLLQAIGIQSGWNPSAVVSAQYTITGTVASPQFTPPSGQYATPQLVTLSTAPSEATIKYTLNGSDPSAVNGLFYTEPIQVSGNTLIKAYAYLEGWNDSVISSSGYVINGAVGTPVISPAPGYYNSSQTVSISAFPGSATIIYTLDGTEPTRENGTAYTGPFQIDSYTQIRAFAYNEFWLDSEIAFAEYYFVVANPSFSLPGGIYADPQLLTLSVSTSGASIRYTMDGSEPTPTHGTVYLEPITISVSGTVKAIAYRNNWVSSNVISQTYVINGPVANPLFTVPEGNYFAEFAVGISAFPGSATIYYTTDGSEPSEENGAVYSTPLTISGNTVLRARAYQTNWMPSGVSTAVYTLQASAVSFAPPAGTYNAVQQINLTTSTPNATIIYTLDGSDPVIGASPVFDPLNPLVLSQNTTIKSLAYRGNWLASAITSATYIIDIPLPIAAVPVITPNSGVYNTPQTVSMSTATQDAGIWYTTDGSDPSPTNGTLYLSEFLISQNTSIRARTYKDGYIPSAIATAQYIIIIPIETVATPSFNPGAGIYNNPVSVNISTATPNASIRYTLDGSEPTDLVGLEYTSPVLIAETTTIKAIAYKVGMNNSLIANASYVINIVIPEVATPQFSLMSGLYQAEIDVAITTATQDATIRYTTDGTLPSESNGTIYSAPIHIGTDSNLFVQAIAFKQGWITSAVASASYVVTGTVAPVSFNPSPGIYTQATSVVLTTATIGSAIRYTLDGSAPTESSTLYTTAIIVPLNTTLTITAKAFKPNWLPSETSQGTYSVTGQVTITPPVFSLPSGTYTTQQTVALNTPLPADAIIRYTTDGFDPTISSPVYSEPLLLPLHSTIIVKARAYKEDWIPSPLYSATYVMTGQVQLADPLFDPPAGTYQTSQAVVIAQPLMPTDATIRYTLDGSEPSVNSPAYTTPIVLPLNSTTMIKAKGFRNDWIPSVTMTATYHITGQVTINTPVFSPPPGIYTTAQMITVNGTQPTDAVVRYTIDGTDPTELSSTYSGPIELPLETALTLKVRAFKNGWAPSTVYTGVYTTTGSVSIALPVFTPEPGLYTIPQSVVLNTTTIPAGAALHYTLDGSDPSESSPVYSTPIAVNTGQSVTIRVRAYAPSWQPSIIHTGSYSVTGQVSIAEPVFTPSAGTYQTAQVITLNIATSPNGATLRYTLDGTEPTQSSAAYVSAIPLGLNSNVTIKVKAFLTGWEPSPTYSAAYLITGSVSLPAPVFSPAAGTYTTAQTVTVATPVPSDAVRHYTTDGTDPTTSSPIYSAPLSIPLNTALTLKVRAFKTDWLPSAIFSASYNVTGQVTLPGTVFTPPGGTYQTAQSITLSLPVLPTDATLRYTLDGSEPTMNSPAYTTPINLPLNSTTTIKAKGYRTDWLPSETVSATFTITGQVTISTPVFTPPPGVYSAAQTIAINSPNPTDAIIRYTTDGSDPTEFSPQYVSPIPLPLNTTMTLKVRAFKSNWTPSAVYTGLYTTTGAVSIAQPVFTPVPGTYTEAQSVVLNTTTIPTGGTLHYTLDGSDPNTSSPIYSTPINISTGQTLMIRVRAYLANWNPSEIYTGTYTVTGQVGINQPVFTPASGTYQTSQLVVINTTTTPAGAIVRYTLDGSDPTPTSPIYTVPLTISSTTTIKVRAYLTSWLPSEVYTAVYTITGQVTISAPVFSPAEGTYQSAQSVSLNTVTNPAGATIRYTTDGSSPTASSPIYSAPILVPLNSTMTIKARAFLTNWTPSQEYSATYTVTGQVQLPATVFTPPAGTYQTAQSVTLNTITNPTGATLRYTLDGSVPTESSPAYTTPINLALNTTTTISVRAYKANWTPSETATATYVITGQIAFQAPVFSPAPGIYQTAQNITVAATTPADASIRYTTDGTEPTVSSPLYSAPIALALNTNTTIKVKAFKDNWTPSITYTGVYTITGQAQIAMPVFSPDGGTYQTAQLLTINTNTTPPGAQIRYTLNGTQPTESSPLYTAPIALELNHTYTVSARAFATNWTPSDTYATSFVITGTVEIAEPVFIPTGGVYYQDLAVVINTQTAPAGAVIRYTVSPQGIEPDQNSPVYTAPISLMVPSYNVVKVKAFKTDWADSPTYTAVYELAGQVQILPPYLTPTPGTYTEPISVFAPMGTNPSGGVIRYTTDGSEPTASSPVFSEPYFIGLNNIGVTIKIKGFLGNWIPSFAHTGVYSVTGQVQLAENTFTPSSGTYQTAQTVSLAQPVLPANAILRYTMDGTDPTENSAAYTSPLLLPQNTVTTLKVRGFATGWIPSETQTATYTITGAVAAPVFSPPGGVYGSTVFVVLSTTSENAQIRFTLDGSEPDENSVMYTEPIQVANFTVNQEIKAKAFKADWTPSSTASATYSIHSSPINVRGFTYAGYIRVLWNLPGQTRDLFGFNIWRRAQGETKFTKINDNLVNTQLDGNYYFDDYEIEIEVTYEYYVTAVYTGGESPASSPTVEYYQSQNLNISEASGAYPNPAVDGTTLKIILNRNDNVQVAVTVYDFAGKKVRTLTAPTTDSNLILINWDLRNANGTKVGRGTYFARVVANDGVNRSEHVIKIAVK